MSPHRLQLEECPTKYVPLRLRGDDCQGLHGINWVSNQARHFNRKPSTVIDNKATGPETYGAICRILDWSLGE